MAVPFNFDRIADTYEGTRRLPPIVLDGLAEQMASVFEEGLVLDAGVGTGRYSEALIARGLRVAGVDISRRMLERARTKGLADLVQGDVTHLPCRDAALDHAIAIHVLHLVPDWRGMVRELARVTRKYVASTAETGEPDVSRGYYDRVGKSKSSKVGIDAEELAELVRPSIRFPRLAYREVQEWNAYLDLLAAKTFTAQWDVPIEAHERAIAELRQETEGKTFESKRTWELLVWRAEDLRALRP